MKSDSPSSAETRRIQLEMMHPSSRTVLLYISSITVLLQGGKNGLQTQWLWKPLDRQLGCECADRSAFKVELLQLKPSGCSCFLSHHNLGKLSNFCGFFWETSLHCIKQKRWNSAPHLGPSFSTRGSWLKLGRSALKGALCSSTRDFFSPPKKISPLPPPQPDDRAGWIRNQGTSTHIWQWWLSAVSYLFQHLLDVFLKNVQESQSVLLNSFKHQKY